MTTLTEQQIQERNQLRKDLLSKRRQYDLTLKGYLSSCICEHILQSEIFASSHNIACYLAVNGEVDLSNVIQTIWQQNKKCYLPLVTKNEKHHMDFIEYKQKDELICNKYNICEPIYKHEKLINPVNLDLVLMPLIGFDDDCNRLGYGGGYYDYTFAFLQQRNNILVKSPKKPYLLGVAFSWQHLDKKITASNTDIALDAVITEKSLLLNNLF